MTVDVLNQKNEKAGTIELPSRIFGVKWNPNLVHQVLVGQLANRREVLAHTKGRGEVSGGGKKPWKQKGTGRSRHGSIRSPLWKGGGVTFGPSKERVFSKKINKKMNQLAIFSVMSQKLKDNQIKVVDSLNMESKDGGKTKEMAKFLKNFVKPRESALLIPTAAGKDLHRLVSNINKADAISPRSLNVYDLMKFKNIILEKEAIKEMEDCYKLVK